MEKVQVYSLRFKEHVQSSGLSLRSKTKVMGKGGALVNHYDEEHGREREVRWLLRMASFAFVVVFIWCGANGEIPMNEFKSKAKDWNIEPPVGKNPNQFTLNNSISSVRMETVSHYVSILGANGKTSGFFETLREAGMGEERE